MRIILICLSMFAPVLTTAQVFGPVAQPDLQTPNNIRLHLMRAAAEISDNALAGINTLEKWLEQRPERYEQFIEMISLTDCPLRGERPPLNVKIAGTLQKEGYCIEKLYYESLPGLYVPANLYIPDNITQPRPAILYVCGHSRTQKVHYQAHARGFAKLGFVCLIIETIQWGEVRGEHWGCYSNGWFHWYSRGYTPGGVEVWNAIRGLDLLCARAEVDPENLGVTGISGGGSQSWYIAAADPRIKAAAPVCGASTLKAHIRARTVDGHCDCMVPINSYQRDFHDIGALIAPRPLLIAQANRDGLNTIESVRELYHAIKNIYDLYGASEEISLVETPGGHSYHPISRTKIFSFFLRHLMGKEILYSEIEDIDQSETAQLSEQQLRVYSDGAPPGDRSKTIQDSFIRLPGAPRITTAEQLAARRAQVLDFLRRKTFSAFPEKTVLFDSRLEFRTLDSGPSGRTVLSFACEKDWRLKVDLRWRHERDRQNPMMVVLRNPCEKRWASEEMVSGLDPSWNIAYLETRGTGETGWAPELSWHVRRAAAWTGRTVASMRVYDVLRTVAFLRTLEGVDPGQVGLMARDEMAAVALYAALLDGNCTAVILQDPPATQDAPSQPDGRGPAIEMLNCLRMTDLYQIPALLCPAEIVFIGGMPAAYGYSQTIYSELGRSDRFLRVKSLAEFRQ